ncbi:ABC transporter ATP-binding protein OS=Stutzerimonas stutzeri OX=316 GN=CXK95_05775 PE=4 SV=1 [Stutzerimonas stutzeri]
MRLLESVGLADRRHEPAADLSYGRKRVLELATTLALEPRVLLLDEPLAGMGHEDVHTVAEIIRQVATERAVLMVEHNLKVVADLCHQVTVLQRGEILTSGDYRSVSQDERVRVAYVGTEVAEALLSMRDLNA